MEAWSSLHTAIFVTALQSVKQKVKQKGKAGAALILLLQMLS